jgi:phosphoribosylformylglycinamidine (FGAM) synthase-like amidotransferase family enzyme
MGNIDHEVDEKRNKKNKLTGICNGVTMFFCEVRTDIYDTV